MDHQVILAVAGGIFIALLFFAKFNTWAPTEPRAKSANPPRHFTTCGRYVSFAIAYTAIYEVLYVFIVSFPDITPVLADAAKSFSLPIPGFNLKSFQQNPSLWSVIIVAAILPSLPEKVNLDFYLRNWLHRRAFITTEADSIIDNLQLHFEKFAPKNEVIERVLKEKSIGAKKEEFLERRNTVLHKWAKLSYLMYLFRRWETRRAVKQFLESYDEEWKQLSADYDELKAQISRYRAEVRKQNRIGNRKRITGDIAKLLEPGLNKALDENLRALYTLITCGVLATTTIPRQRRKAFDFFGLNPEPGLIVNFDWDTILKSIVVVFVATLIPVLIYYVYAFADPGVIAEANNKHIPVPASPAMAALWSFISLSLQGGAVLITLLVNRIWTKHQSTVEEDSKIFFLQPSFLRRFVCAASAYIVGFVILFIAAFLMPPEQDGGLATVIQQIWPFAILPAVTGYFVSSYIREAVNLKAGQPDPSLGKQWWNALKHASALAVAGILAGLFFFNRWWVDPVEVPFLVLIVSTMFFIGLGIGYVFPRGYRKLRRERNRREQLRYKVIRPVQVLDAGRSIGCRLIDVSVAGAGLDTAVRQSVGRTIQLKFRNLGTMLAKVVRLEHNRTYVEFLHDRDTKQRLSNYVMTLAGARG